MLGGIGVMDGVNLVLALIVGAIGIDVDYHLAVLELCTTPDLPIPALTPCDTLHDRGDVGRCLRYYLRTCGVCIGYGAGSRAHGVQHNATRKDTEGGEDTVQERPLDNCE